VIGEFVVHLWEFHPGHVAGDALLFANRTCGRAANAGPGFSSAGEMAGQALGVIENGIALQPGVRVVTGDATDPGIISEVRGALEHPIRLKADVSRAALSGHEHNRIEALMAGTTEFLCLVEGVQGTRVKDAQVFEVTGPYGSDVLFARAMTTLTGNSRNDVARVQIRSTLDRGGVTVKAASSGLGTHRAAQGVLERGRHPAGVENSDIEALNLLIIADAALVKEALVLKEIRLAGDAMAEAKHYGFGDFT
jgi:hypothetical protein